MKTVTLRAPHSLVLDDRPAPAMPPGTVTVAVKRVGVCGTDYHAVDGVQPYFTYPRVLGHELAGIVRASAQPGSPWTAGQPVAIRPYLECGQCTACRTGKPNCCQHLRVLGVHIDGGMAEELVVPADHLVSAEGLTLDQAVTMEFLSIGHHAVERSNIRSGEWAAVVGAGPVGLAVLAFCRLKGARTIAVDVSDTRLAFARDWAQADSILAGAADLDAEIQRAAGGDRPAVVFDATGNPAMMRETPRLVAHGGRLVYVGLAQTDIVIWDPLLHEREMTVLSSRNALQADFEDVRDAIRSGRVTTEPLITNRIAFVDAPDALQTAPRPDTIKQIVDIP